MSFLGMLKTIADIAKTAAETRQVSSDTDLAVKAANEKRDMESRISALEKALAKQEGK